MPPLNRPVDMPTPGDSRRQPSAAGLSGHAHESAKEMIESIVIAFILAFTFRAYVVEAFVIPTGSMAPTLLGAHFDLTCPQCGRNFAVDTPEPGRGDNPPPPLESQVVALCPSCHYPISLRVGMHAGPGDRILVLKYLYSLHPPQRWDVVVFKNPEDPNLNFIKRLVGLPGESLVIVDGNIYVQADGAKDWRIARKTDRPEVQRAVWQPLYHSQFVPLDGGVTFPGARARWRTPWTPQQPELWDVEQRRVYQYHGQREGTLQFDFQRTIEQSPGQYPYDQLKAARLPRRPVEDVRLAATVTPSAAGLTVSLTTTARLDQSPSALPLFVQLDRSGLAQMVTLDSQGGQRVLDQQQLAPLAAGKPTRLELWYADQQASFWVNGQRVLNWEYDLSLEEILNRPVAVPDPNVAITLDGAASTLSEVELDRDLYYWSLNAFSGGQARGALVRTGSGIYGEPLVLPAGQFFCMGDNSPMSHDGRFWTRVDPWIQERLLGPGEGPGTVPSELMMGRAFFVYFPAPYRWNPQGRGLAGRGLIPNFADMRFID